MNYREKRIAADLPLNSAYRDWLEWRRELGEEAYQKIKNRVRQEALEARDRMKRAIAESAAPSPYSQ